MSIETWEDHLRYIRSNRRRFLESWIAQARSRDSHDPSYRRANAAVLLVASEEGLVELTEEEFNEIAQFQLGLLHGFDGYGGSLP